MRFRHDPIPPCTAEECQLMHVADYRMHQVRQRTRSYCIYSQHDPNSP